MRICLLERIIARNTAIRSSGRQKDMKQNRYAKCIGQTPLLVVMSMSIASGGALAQEAGDNGSEIVVTAQKREQKIQDIGLTVNAFTADKLQESGITKSDDIAKILTNVVIRPQLAGEAPTFSIRGISSGAAIFSNTSSPVALNVDGIYLTSGALATFGLFDLARVEVLKGPQGTLFGKNTTGGVVNYITAQPVFENSGYFDGSYQRFNELRMTAVGNIMLGENSALRVSLLRHAGDGYIYDTSRDGYIGSPDIWAGRVALKSRFGDSWTMNLNLHGGIDRSRPLQQKQSGRVGVGCAAVGKGDLPPTTCVDNFGYSDKNPNPFAGDWSGTDRRNNRSIGAFLQVDGELGAVNFTSVTGLDYLKRYTVSDEDAGPMTTADIYYHERVTQGSQEFRVSSHPGGPLFWVAGMYFEANSLRANRDVPTFSNTLNIQFRSRNRGRSAAAFVDAEYGLTDQLKLIGGLRYTWEQKRNVTNNTFYSVTTGALVERRCTDVICNGNKSWSDPSGRVGLEFRASPGNLLYASYNRGFKSGGWPAGATVLPLNYKNYDPEYVNAFEIGAKTLNFDRRLMFNASAFYYKYSNKQEYILIPGATPTAVLQIFANAASATVYGAELETAYRSDNGWVFELGVGYLHTKYDEYNLPASVASNPAAPQLTGKEFALAPKMTATGAVSYKIVVNDDVIVTPKLNGRYQSSMWWTADNLNALAEKSYAFLDGRIDMNLVKKGIKISAYVLNLTDKIYRTGVTVGPVNSFYSTYAPPRTYGMSVRYSF